MNHFEQSNIDPNLIAAIAVAVEHGHRVIEISENGIQTYSSLRAYRQVLSDRCAGNHLVHVALTLDGTIVSSRLLDTVVQDDSRRRV